MVEPTLLSRLNSYFSPLDSNRKYLYRSLDAEQSLAGCLAQRAKPGVTWGRKADGTYPLGASDTADLRAMALGRAEQNTKDYKLAGLLE